MPLYAYRATADGCAHCADRFEVMQRMSDAPLDACPVCGAAVTRLLGRVTFAGTSAAKPDMSNSNLERLGFTQYRRNRDGTYHKAFGKGPDKVTKD